MVRKQDKIDDKPLSKKYRTNVKRIIAAWKKGYSDMEISKLLGLDMFTLQQIKTEIELTHRRLRMERKRKSLAQ
jgi:uncharacterized protein (DUF433 family)